MNDATWVAGNWHDVKAGDWARVPVARSEFDAICTSTGGGAYFSFHIPGTRATAFLTYRPSPDGTEPAFKIPAPTTPLLPTVPGYYLDKEGEVWRFAGKEFSLEFRDYAILHAPFTRLEPVSETAGKVFDRFEALYDLAPTSEVIHELRKEFGA